jgi:ribokinase
MLAVLGAINVDLVVSGVPLPHARETVIGGVFTEHQGGKGGNQAVAAARAMGDDGGVHAVADPRSRPGTCMLGAVGDDRLGARALEALRAEDVRTDHVLVASETPTGVALIVVDATGENQIAVAPGANARLTATHVIDALETLRPRVLLASLEVPEAAVRAALEWCDSHGVTTVLNPAPPQTWVRDLLRLGTYVTPNAHELEALGDVPDDVVVIETRGADGVRIHRRGTIVVVPAPKVPVVDTTGAGDCFNGVLAARLVEGRTLEDAMADAVAAAALSVAVAGAREGMPTRPEIEAARRRS